MNNYAELYQDKSFKTERSLDPNWVNMLIQTGNAKADYFLPLVQDEEPNYNQETQVLEFGGYIVELNRVRKTWVIRDLSEEEIAEKNRKVWTAYEFLMKLTPEERYNIRELAKTDPNIGDFLHLSQAAQEIISDDPITVMGMNYMVFVGIFSEQRKNEILEIL
jgi:hypothetical protein